MINRRKTRQIQIGNVKVGGGAPITVQSMTKTDTRDVQATLLEIWSLEAAGCDIVRCAVPVREAAEKLGEIKRQIRIPLVADIHFNYKLALIALEQGVDGLRLNPGNIGGKKFVMEVVSLAKDRKIPIRIGVNAGSLEKDLLDKYNGPTAQGMVESAEEVRVGIDLLKALGLRRGGLTFVSCPSCGRADVDLVKLAKEVEDEFRGLNEEIHIAVMGCVPEGQPVITPAGATPIESVDEGAEVLTHEGEYRKVLWATRHAFDGELIEIRPVGFAPFRVTPNHQILAAPRAQAEREWVRADRLAAGWVLAYPVPEENVERARVATADVVEVRRVQYTGHVHNLEVDGIHSYAVSGAALHNCEVNGPGEARAADIGVAGGRGVGLIFKGGEVIRKGPEAGIVSAMREEVDKFVAERKAAKATAGADD